MAGISNAAPRGGLRAMRRPREARSSPGNRLLLSMLVAVALSTAWQLGDAFATTTGLTRKQRRSTLHNKDRLATLYELSEEVPEPEPEALDPMPERRVPYTMNIVAQFPDEENPNWKYLERKFQHSLQNSEDMIRHVEVRVIAAPHFHREKPGRGHRRAAPAMEVDVDNEEPVEVPGKLQAVEQRGSDELMPFKVKATVSLMNHRQLVLSNAEKHAQPTLTEAVDHAADLLRKMLREEKERSIRLGRRRHRMQKDAGAELPMFEDEDDYLAADEALEERMEAVYRARWAGDLE